MNFSDYLSILIYEKLEPKALEHNEIEWQQQVMQPYEGWALAQYLERLLFLCPHCEQPGELRLRETDLAVNIAGIPFAISLWNVRTAARSAILCDRS